MKRTTTQTKSVLALALTLAAVAAPAAQAEFLFTPGDGAAPAGLPTIAELQQFRFTPSDAPGLPTLSHPFSFDGPPEPRVEERSSEPGQTFSRPAPADSLAARASSEPGTPTVVAAAPNFPSASELWKFSFTPESQAPPAVSPASRRAASTGRTPESGPGSGSAPCSSARQLRWAFAATRGSPTPEHELELDPGASGSAGPGVEP